MIGTSHKRFTCSTAVAVVTSMALSLCPTPATAAAQRGTAAEFYVSYRAAFDKAKKIEELLPFLAAKNRQEVEKTPPDERVKLFELMKMFGAMTDVKVVKATQSGTGEMLSIEGLSSGKKQTCNVQILSEGGAWKVGEEKCSGSL